MLGKFLRLGSLVVVLSLLLMPMAGATNAQEPPPLEEQIEQSIVAGLAWLALQQNLDGSWGWG